MVLDDIIQNCIFMTLYEYRQIIVPASILVPVSIAVFRYGKLPPYGKCLLYYLVFTGAVNITAIILAWNGMNNIWLLHILTPVESFFLLFYFRYVIPNKKVTALIGILMWVFPLFCAVNSLFLQDLSNFNT